MLLLALLFLIVILWAWAVEWTARQAERIEALKDEELDGLGGADDPYASGWSVK